VNTARLLLPERRRAMAGSTAQASGAGFSTFETGCRYAAMGFTTVVEPAVAPHDALHAHLELADIPIIDKAILVVLGNDDLLLGMMQANESEAAVRDYVAWTLDASHALGIKVINAGGAAAFKSNLRAFSLDDVVPLYGVTSRAIVKTLQHAVHDLGVPHPLHVHCNNLGLPGNAETALATIGAAEGVRLHLAHLQFYGYGRDGARGFSSAGAQLAEAVNQTKDVTIDVGQVMFGETVTVSSDVLLQFNARKRASPKKWVIFDGDSNGGGVVPVNYRADSFHNAVQWAVGLELFLLIEDPWRVFFTTDHPNGAPFTAYPDLFALLMDRDLRARWIADLPPAAMEVTTLPAISREYSLTEIATMTRAAPARLLGLADRGHLGPGAVADIAVYSVEADKAKMFRAAALVFKDGELVVRNGEVTHCRWGRALHVRPERDRAIDRRMNAYYDERYGLSPDVIKVPESAIGRPDPFGLVPCAR
jgi:formylmethanofuran dehydrogenase subunit A